MGVVCVAASGQTFALEMRQRAGVTCAGRASDEPRVIAALRQLMVAATQALDETLDALETAAGRVVMALCVGAALVWIVGEAPEPLDPASLAATSAASARAGNPLARGEAGTRSAPLVVIFSDDSCPSCASTHRARLRTIAQNLSDARIAWQWVDVARLGTHGHALARPLQQLPTVVTFVSGRETARMAVRARAMVDTASASDEPSLSPTRLRPSLGPIDRVRGPDGPLALVDDAASVPHQSRAR